MSKLNDVLQSGFYCSHLGAYNVDWFLDEVIWLKINRYSPLKPLRKIFEKTEEDGEHFKNNKPIIY